MSVHVSSLVWRESKAQGAALLVLLSLADQCNDDGECWPKIDAIAARCRVGRRSLFRYLTELERLGELERVDRHAQGLATLYRVKLVPNWHHPSANSDTGVVPPLAPQETSLEPSLTNSPAAPAADLFDAFWLVYPRHKARPAARRKWDSLTTGRNAVDPAVIIAGAERYAADCRARGVAQEYIAHPLTWLNQGRWEDEPEGGTGTRSEVFL